MGLLNYSLDQIRSDIKNYCSSSRATGIMAVGIKTRGRSLDEGVVVSIPTPKIEIRPVTGQNIVNEKILEILSKEDGITTSRLSAVIKKYGPIVSEDELMSLHDTRFLGIEHRLFVRRIREKVYILCGLSEKTIKNIAPGSEKVGTKLYSVPITELLGIYKKFENGDMILDEEMADIFSKIYTPREKIVTKFVDEFMDL